VTEDGRARIPLLRVLVEGLVIVASILLAFGIEAWWQGREEQEEAHDALEILRRDLTATTDQLDELVQFAQEGSDAALRAYVALGDDIANVDPRAVSNDLIRSLSRRTMRLPRAGYTDLLSTGTLGLIDDRDLRDAVVQFYEQAERAETIFEKNSAQYIDGYLSRLLVGGGLIVVRPTGVGVPAQVRRDEIIQERLGEYEHPADPLWNLPRGAREWDQLRSALLSMSRATQMQVIRLNSLVEMCDNLLALIEARTDS
jgi:hypothetical protein